MPSKIAIIGGGGSVGATAAYACIIKNVASEIMLVDIDANKCRAQVLDLADAAFKSDTVVSQGTMEDAGIDLYLSIRSMRYYRYYGW